jgi:hypothetical protein
VARFCRAQSAHGASTELWSSLSNGFSSSGKPSYTPVQNFEATCPAPSLLHVQLFRRPLHTKGGIWASRAASILAVWARSEQPCERVFGSDFRHNERRHSFSDILENLAPQHRAPSAKSNATEERGRRHSFGRSHDHPNLFIARASLFQGSGTANPRLRRWQSRCGAFQSLSVREARWWSRITLAIDHLQAHLIELDARLTDITQDRFLSRAGRLAACSVDRHLDRSASPRRAAWRSVVPVAARAHSVSGLGGRKLERRAPSRIEDTGDDSVTTGRAR